MPYFGDQTQLVHILGNYTPPAIISGSSTRIEGWVPTTTTGDTIDLTLPQPNLILGGPYVPAPDEADRQQMAEDNLRRIQEMMAAMGAGAFGERTRKRAPIRPPPREEEKPEPESSYRKKGRNIDL